MGNWTKNAGEKLLVGKNWTVDMAGAAIATTPDPVVPEGVTFTLVQLSPSGATTRYWLDGGEPGETATVTITITTSEGETLDQYVRVIIR